MRNDYDIARGDLPRQESPFFNTAQAAYFLRLAPRRLERLRTRGGGPVFRRHARFVVYHLDDLMAWSNASRSEGNDA